MRRASDSAGDFEPRWSEWVPAHRGAIAHDDGRRVFADTDEVTVDPHPRRSGRGGNRRRELWGNRRLAGSEPLVWGVDGSTTPRYDRYVILTIVPQRFG
ncbi:MAG: hypothetical protein EOP32_25750 [Rhodococcus sp. (in: high G+C Gram-positive bacteria)]|nr:MAG: hypothetical protein EOP32_25750 [Rhodococcus sp. (in: high G+C Gram-positive bacteria)]